MISKNNNGDIFLRIEDNDGYEFEEIFTKDEILREYSSQEILEYYLKNNIDSNTFTKETLKRFLCDIVEVGYHTDTDTVLKKIKNKL